MLTARLLRIVIVSYLLCACAASHAQQQFSQLIIFGDSLSDTGNVAGVVTPNLPPPYFDNRISNGPLAVDVFALSIGKNANAASSNGGTNYAVIGGNILGDDFEDLTTQIDRYFADSEGVADSEALYLLFMGGNDLRSLRGQPNALIAAQQIDDILLILSGQLNRLIDAGAKNVVVANVADIGRIPETLQKEAGEPGITARASGYVELYNARLSERLIALAAQPMISLYDFNVFSELSRMLDSPSQFGFLRSDVACFDPDNFDFHPDCDSGLFPILPARFERFVFFDNLHPTSQAHSIVGNALTSRLNSPPLTPPVENRRLFNIATILLLLLD